MADFALDTTDYSKLTGSQGRGTSGSLDTDTGVLSVTEDSTNTFATGARFWEHARKFYLYDTNSVFVGEANIVGPLSDANSKKRFQLELRIDNLGNNAFFTDFAGENVDDKVDDTGAQVLLTGTFADVDWTANTNLATLEEVRAHEAYEFFQTIGNSEIVDNRVVNDESLILGDASSTTPHTALALYNQDVSLWWWKLNNNVDSPENIYAGPYRVSSGVVTWNTMTNWQTYTSRGISIFDLATDNDSKTEDKHVFSFAAGIGGSGRRGACHAYYGVRFQSTSNRHRLFGQERILDGYANADDCNWGKLTVANCHINQDIVTITAGNPFASSAGTGNYANFGRREDVKFINCRIIMSGNNGIGIRSNAEITGGSLEGYTFESGNNLGPLAAFGFKGGSATAPREIGAPGNEKLQVKLFGDDPSADDDQAFLNRTGGGTADDTTYMILTNVDSTDRRSRFNSDAADRVGDLTRLQFRYSGRWHNLEEGSKAYISYDTDNTSHNSRHGWSNLFDDPTTQTADSNGQLDIDIIDAVHRAHNKTLSSYATTTYGYRYPNATDSDGDNDSYWNGNVSYSIKNFGFLDIVNRGLSRYTQGIGSDDVLSWRVSANETSSLGGGMTGGDVQTADPNITNGLDQDGAAISETNIATLMGTWDGTSQHYPNMNRSADSSFAWMTYYDGWASATDDRVRTLDELYAMIHYQFAVPGSDSDGRKHIANPLTTVESDNGVWDWRSSALNSDSTITSVGLRFSVGTDDESRFTAQGSTIKGIRSNGPTDTDQFTLEEQFVLDHGIIIEAAGQSLTSTGFYSTMGSGSTFDSDYSGGSSNGIGAMLLKGRWDIHTTGTTVHLYFNNETAEPADDADGGLLLYADPSDDDADAQGQIFFDVPDNTTINIYGLDRPANLQTGATKGFHTTATGVTWNFRRNVNVRVSFPEGESSISSTDAKVAFWQKDPDDDSASFEQVSGSYTNADVIASGEAWWQIRVDSGKDLYYAIQAYDTSDTTPKSYKLVTGQTRTADDHIIELEELDVIKTDAGFGSLAYGDISVAAVTASDGDVQVDLDAASTDANLVKNNADFLLHNGVCRQEAWLDAMAKGWIPSTPFTYGPDEVVVDDGFDNDGTYRLRFNTTNDRAPFHLQTTMVDESGADLYSDLTDTASPNDARIVYFAPKQDLTVRQIVEALEDEGITGRNLQAAINGGNYKDPEGNLVFDPKFD